MIQQVPDYSIAEIKKKAIYEVLTCESEVVVWFWEILEQMTLQERNRFSHFISARSVPPINFSLKIAPIKR